MGVENHIKNPDEEGYRSMGKMLSGPVWNTVWARSPADLETPDGFVNLIRVVQLGFASWGGEVGPQCHAKHLNKCQDRKNGYQLTLCLQTLGQEFSFLWVQETDTPLGDQGRRWSRNSHHLFGHPPQQLVFRIKGFKLCTPLVIPALIHLVGLWPLLAVNLSSQSGDPGDLQMLTQPFLQVYHILNTSWYRGPQVITRRLLRVEAVRAFITVVSDRFSMHVLIATTLCKSRLIGILSSRWAWKSAQSMGLKSGRSSGCRVGECHIVSIIIGRRSKLRAEHKNRYTGEGRSKTSRVVEML